jgi:hypothetical protein
MSNKWCILFRNSTILEINYLSEIFKKQRKKKEEEETEKEEKRFQIHREFNKK